MLMEQKLLTTVMFTYKFLIKLFGGKFLADLMTSRKTVHTTYTNSYGVKFMKIIT
jgi:hypothetical protein